LPERRSVPQQLFGTFQQRSPHLLPALEPMTVCSELSRIRITLEIPSGLLSEGAKSPLPPSIEDTLSRCRTISQVWSSGQEKSSLHLTVDYIGCEFVIARSETTKQSPKLGDCFAPLAMTVFDRRKLKDHAAIKPNRLCRKQGNWQTRPAYGSPRLHGNTAVPHSRICPSQGQALRGKGQWDAVAARLSLYHSNRNSGAY
jgi:hypothetical protein